MARASGSAPRLRGLPFGPVALATLLVTQFVVRWGFGFHLEGSDTAVYLSAGQAVLDGTDPYALRVGADGRPFTYPPFAALLFAPMSMVPSYVVVPLQALVSVAALGAATVALARRDDLKGRLLLLVAAALFTEPLFAAVLVGQVDPVIVALTVTGCCLLPPRHRGWLVGLAAAIKLTPLVFLAVFFLDRNWRTLTQTLLVFGGSVILGALVLPGPSRYFWSGGAGDVGRFEADAGPRLDNMSMRAVVLRALREPSMPMWATFSISAACLGLATWVAFRCYRRGSREEAVAAMALGGVLASPIAWSTHWVWVAPVTVFLLSSRRRIMAVVLVMVASTQPAYWLGWDYYHGLKELRIPWSLQVIAGSLTLLALAILLRLGWRPASRELRAWSSGTRDDSASTGPEEEARDPDPLTRAADRNDPTAPGQR